MMPGRKGDLVSLVLDQEVVIASNSDLVITLLSPVENSSRNVTEVLVSCAVCMQSRYTQGVRCNHLLTISAAGKYLNSLITTSEDQTEITLGGELKREGANKFGQEEGIDKDGALVWLAHLHELSEQQMAGLGLHEISITGIWEAILSWMYKEKQADLKALKPWFEKWYDTTGVCPHDIDSARLLALPCQLFDHAEGYARVTKFLAYNSIGHVKERQPKGFRAKSLHLAPAEFVGEYSEYDPISFLSTA